MSSPFAANRALWNARTEVHLRSEMYDVEGFVAGRNSLSELELELLGDVRGKRILHLQCHFGQDTLSLARMGAEVTGLDISDTAVAEAHKLTERMGLQAEWVLANVLDFQPQLEGRFDIVFTSFGTIGWLPELRTWADNIQRYLAPGGRFVFVEFHPMLWMFDDDFRELKYSWFNRETIEETSKGTYADRNAPIEFTSHSWNHPQGDVLGALLGAGLRITHYSELDGSPHNVFPRPLKGDDGLYRIEGFERVLPMVFGLCATKP
jgi:SAM-dependent methyltransferase